jgi:hypothetical protein
VERDPEPPVGQGHPDKDFSCRQTFVRPVLIKFDLKLSDDEPGAGFIDTTPSSTPCTRRFEAELR